MDAENVSSRGRSGTACHAGQCGVLRTFSHVEPAPERMAPLLPVLVLLACFLVLPNTAASQSDLPTVSVSGGSATEGVAVDFTVSLSAENDQVVTVQYATSSGTATSGTDFTAASGTLAFPSGSTAGTSATVSVKTTQDTDDEQDETFTLTLSSPTNATLGASSATGTINEPDENSPPVVSVSGRNSATEGDAVEFTFTFSKATGSDVWVQGRPIRASGDTATRGDDFSGTTRLVLVAEGVTSATTRVPTTDDTLDEDSETFTLWLTNARNVSVGASDTAVGTISGQRLPADGERVRCERNRRRRRELPGIAVG